jgi:hypothetical protein
VSKLSYGFSGRMLTNCPGGIDESRPQRASGGCQTDGKSKLKSEHYGERRLHCGLTLGSGDGERKTLLTRQIAFEPLPASVWFALGWPKVS